MCCICSMHVYSSALCLEWNDHSDVFFITEQHFLRLWCFMYRAIITICHLGAWSVANLQSFDACNNYYYWCHCTIFKIQTYHCKSTANRKERQSVHTKTRNSLLVNIWKSVRRHSTASSEALTVNARAPRAEMWCSVCAGLCTENSSGKLSTGISRCHILTICFWSLTLHSAIWHVSGNSYT